MTEFTRWPVWRITGKVVLDRDGDRSRDGRTVLLAAFDFDHAVRLSKDALMHQWSRYTVGAEVSSINAVAEGNDQVVVRVATGD